jgi:hypothetical protein
MVGLSYRLGPHDETAALLCHLSDGEVRPKKAFDDRLNGNTTEFVLRHPRGQHTT